MDQAVDSRLQFNEGAVVGQVADLCNYAAADGYLRSTSSQGFCSVCLLNAQRDFSFLFLDREDDRFNFVAYMDHFAGFSDVLCPRHFRDVDEPFDARFDLNEGAVRNQVDDLALNACPGDIFSISSHGFASFA